MRLRPLAFTTFLVWRLRIGACGLALMTATRNCLLPILINHCGVFFFFQDFINGVGSERHITQRRRTCSRHRFLQSEDDAEPWGNQSWRCRTLNSGRSRRLERYAHSRRYYFGSRIGGKSSGFFSEKYISCNNHARFRVAMLISVGYGNTIQTINVLLFCPHDITFFFFTPETETRAWGDRLQKTLANAGKTEKWKGNH